MPLFIKGDCLGSHLGPIGLRHTRAIATPGKSFLPRDVFKFVCTALLLFAVTWSHAASPHDILGPSSRTTPIVFSEIMYKPAPRADGRNLEYLELYNSNPWFQDISGYQITCADMSYTFPPGATIASNSFIVIAAAPADMASVYGTDTNNQTVVAVVNQPITNWPPNAALWLVWEMADPAGKSQGLAVDNLSFSATAHATLRAVSLAAQTYGANVVLARLDRIAGPDVSTAI